MKFESIDTDYKIQLMEDKPTPQESQWGVQNEYSITYNGQPYSLTASAGLHKQLCLYGRGSNLNIRKEAFGEGKTKFVVTSNGVTPPSAMAGTPTTAPVTASGVDARTKDIHRQVCLKLACQMFGESQVTLSAGSITVIEANMLQLLQVLDGDTEPETKESDFPF